MSNKLEQGPLRSQLTRLALEIRPTNVINGPLDEPELVQDYEYNDGERINSRIKIYLRSRGCISATCTMCPMPGETSYGNDSLIKTDNYLKQFASVFKDRSIDDYDVICVYNSGNWFADREIPVETRKGIYQTVAKSNAKAMMVQSLPQFITAKTMEEAKSILGDKKLIVGIGLQSSNDTVRNLCVNTTCTKEQFERATQLLTNNGYATETYIMIKPPFLTEPEAIQDTVDSIQYLDSIGLKNVSICPTRVSPHTIVWELAKRGLYKTPSLWTVVDILKIANERNLRIRVACLDIDGKDSETLYPKGCEKCSSQVLSALRQYNIKGDISVLNDLSCEGCEDQHTLQLKESESTSLQERVNNFVKRYILEKDTGKK